MDIILVLISALISGGIKLFLMVRKFSDFRRYCKVYDYSFTGFYEKIGLIYRRELPYLDLLNLLNKYHITAILFPKGFKVFEYLVIVDFPYQEEKYNVLSNTIIYGHGGIRFFHFYSLSVKENEQWVCRPYETLYIGKDEGKFISYPSLLKGEFITSTIEASTKDALLNLIEEGKYWNGGEKVIIKYDGLIQLLLKHHKDFDVYEESPCEVSMNDHTNGIGVYLKQKYKKDNIDKILTVSIIYTKNMLFDITKDFEENENFNTVFYTIWNEYTKEKIRRSCNFESDSVKGWEVPTAKLLSDLEVTNALQKIEDRKERNKNASNQEAEKEEVKVLQIEQNTENLSDETEVLIGDIPVEDIVFIKDWPLLSFAKTFGPKMQVGSFTEEIYNIIYKACVFTKSDGTKTYVYFFHELGELSPQEIKDRKNELYIGKVPNGDYYLYSKDNKGWRVDNSGKAEIEYKNNIKPNITSLSNFIKTHGKLSIGSFTNNETGEQETLYAFTDIQGNRIFAFPSPLIGVVSEEEIKQNKEDFYIYWEKEGCYFLCTEMSEQMLKDRDTEPAYFMAEYSLESTLTLLNIEKNFNDFSLCFKDKIEEDVYEKANEIIAKIRENIYAKIGRNIDDDIQKTYDSLNLYNGDTDNEISLLTVEQKIALFSLLVFLGGSSTLESNKDEVADVVRTFASTIKLYEENINENTFNEITSDRSKCIVLVKTVHIDTPLIELILACNSLKDISNDSPSFLYEYEHLLLDIGFSKEDIKDIEHGKYNYRFKE